MAMVYLGLGSNIDPEDNLRLGIRELRRRYGDVEVSKVYRNAAVGFEGDDFLNLVAGFESDEEPAEIVRYIEQIHDLAGRERPRASGRGRSVRAGRSSVPGSPEGGVPMAPDRPPSEAWGGELHLRRSGALSVSAPRLRTRTVTVSWPVCRCSTSAR